MRPKLRIADVFFFSIYALVFAIGGGIALFVHTDDMPAQYRADSVRHAIEGLRTRGAGVEDFRRSNGRLPTDSEVTCDWKPCQSFAFIVWHVTPHDDETFALTYMSLGIPFTPVQTYSTTWQSRNGTTDRDGYDQAWRWQFWFGAKAAADVTLILLPWLGLIALWVWRRRIRRKATTRR